MHVGKVKSKGLSENLYAKSDFCTPMFGTFIKSQFTLDMIAVPILFYLYHFRPRLSPQKPILVSEQ